MRMVPWQQCFTRCWCGMHAPARGFSATQSPRPASRSSPQRPPTARIPSWSAPQLQMHDGTCIRHAERGQQQTTRSVAIGAAECRLQQASRLRTTASASMPTGRATVLASDCLHRLCSQLAALLQLFCDGHVNDTRVSSRATNYVLTSCIIECVSSCTAWRPGMLTTSACPRREFCTIIRYDADLTRLLHAAWCASACGLQQQRRT
jgi:hypothetical protein